MSEIAYETTHQMGDIPHIAIFLLLAFFPTFGICIVVLALYVLYISVAVDGYSVSFVIICLCPVIVFGVTCVFLGLAFIQSGLSRYRFQADGLYVIRPLFRNQLIPWDHFQEVCVCRGAFTTRGAPNAATIICCVKHGETKNAAGRWKTDNPFRYNSVISILFSQERYVAIKAVCPFNVNDLRNTSAYKLR